MKRSSVSIAALSGAIGCLLLSGCQPKGDTDGGEKVGDGPLIETAKELQPGGLPGEEAVLVYGGTKVPVQLVQERSGDQVSLKILAHDETSEVEVYRETPESFSLVNAAGESYAPPIELLRFPLRIGSAWDWSGTMEAGGLEKKATAKVGTAKESLFPDTVPLEAVKVTVNLEIEANPPSGPKAKRDLTFWFAPGKGVVRRAFGAASIREPRQDE